MYVQRNHFSYVIPTKLVVFELRAYHQEIKDLMYQSKPSILI